MNPVIDECGTKYWIKDGRYHRLDGPAAEFTNGNKVWLKDGEYHREDGPAVEYADGDKYWYYEGKYIDCKTQEEFERLIRLKAFW